MGDLRQDIEQARIETGVVADDLQLVSPHRYFAILDEILLRFTTLGRERHKAIWLWNHLREPLDGLGSVEHWNLLSVLLDADERVWFLAEDFYRSKKQSPFWLYEGTVAAIQAIVSECRHFEYNLVSKKYAWLLAVDHHDCLRGSGEPLVAAIQAYRRQQGR